MRSSVWGLCLGLLAIGPISGATSIPQYWSYRSAIYNESRGNYPAAVKILERLSANAPGNAPLRQALADAYFMNNQLDKAQTIYLSLVKSGPKEAVPQVLYNMGNVAFRAGRYSEAINWYRKALSLNPGDNQAKNNLELAQHQLEKPSQNDTPPPPPPIPNSLDQLERDARHHHRNPHPARTTSVEKDW